jgi:hypothetical protein
MLVSVLDLPLVGVAALGIRLVNDPCRTRRGLPNVFLRDFLVVLDLMQRYSVPIVGPEASPDHRSGG